MRYKNSEKVYKSHLKEVIPMIIHMLRNKSKESKPKYNSDIPVNYLK